MDLYLKEKLLLLAERYEVPEFIKEDPIQIPHQYSKKADIEISALLTSWIATGNRKFIIRTADKVDREVLGRKPLNYIMSGSWEAYKENRKSFYRYYSFHDFYLLCQTLHAVYTRSDSLEDHLRREFPEISPLKGLQTVFGHINGMPEPSSNSEAKKLCMFLRWVVRKDSPVDLGIWEQYHSRDLLIPLDTHVHRISIDLGLTEKGKSIKTAREITSALCEVWPDDPAKGDFALFGYGINE
ncbi:TIGR02757 family protein [Bacteroides sp.]